jgi:site-specific DNA-cytosine methylase
MTDIVFAENGIRPIKDGRSLSEFGTISYESSKAMAIIKEHVPKVFTGLVLAGHDETISHEQQSRVYSPLGKAPCLMANSGGGGYDKQPKVAIGKIYYRKLTVKECERLQGVPDDYCQRIHKEPKKLVSNSAAYQMLGNGWQVDTIMHIFQYLKDEK